MYTLGATVVDVDLTNGTQVAWTETFLLQDHLSTSRNDSFNSFKELVLTGSFLPKKFHSCKLLILEFYTYGKVVVNAGGPFCDSVRNVTDIDAKLMICPSSGVHIVLPDYYSPEGMGLIVPKTKDGRVVLMLPWLGRTDAGTTDFNTSITMLPEPHEDEIEFISDAICDYLNVKVRRTDVLSAWSDIRPLATDPTVHAPLNMDLVGSPFTWFLDNATLDSLYDDAIRRTNQSMAAMAQQQHTYMLQQQQYPLFKNKDIIGKTLYIRAINGVTVHANTRKTGMIILGGLPKHHICNANKIPNGSDYARRIRSSTESVKVNCDVTIAFPLHVAKTFAAKRKKPAATALFWTVIAVGNYGSTLLVSIVHKMSTGQDGSNWLPDENLNKEYPKEYEGHFLL
nr:glycerol-3-phosphate dehydrogenase SDP6, mitochondrial [Tanacetum cinerariifolium]